MIMENYKPETDSDQLNVHLDHIRKAFGADFSFVCIGRSVVEKDGSRGTAAGGVSFAEKDVNSVHAFIECSVRTMSNTLKELTGGNLEIVVREVRSGEILEITEGQVAKE